MEILEDRLRDFAKALAFAYTRYAWRRPPGFREEPDFELVFDSDSSGSPLVRFISRSCPWMSATVLKPKKTLHDRVYKLDGCFKPDETVFFEDVLRTPEESWLKTAILEALAAIWKDGARIYDAFEGDFTTLFEDPEKLVLESSLAWTF